MAITKQQQLKLSFKWKESHQGLTYLQFRRTIQPDLGSDGALLVSWCGQWLGIEPDGYCHT